MSIRIIVYGRGEERERAREEKRERERERESYSNSKFNLLSVEKKLYRLFNFGLDFGDITVFKKSK